MSEVCGDTNIDKKFKVAGCTLAGRWWSFVGKVAKADGTPISLGYVWGAPIPIRHDPACTDEYVEEVRRPTETAAALETFHPPRNT